MKARLPPGWPRPKGYANGIAASGHLVFTAGVIGWAESERLVSDDLPGQFPQVLVNTLAILHEGGAGPENADRMTWYIPARDHYVAPPPPLGPHYPHLTGPDKPTTPAVQVGALGNPGRA